MNIETLLIHGGVDGDKKTGAVTVPIYQTSTFRQKEVRGTFEYEYSRTGNPTREALEKLSAELEGGKFGFAFASGMAAITAVLTLFSAGDKILISSNIYGGTYRVLDSIFSQFGITYEFVDTTDLNAVETAIIENVKAILIESPANPLMTVTDIKVIADIARRHGILSIVDNTFMTPYLQQPLSLGTDVVIHSATKYLGGHSDLIAGLVIVNDSGLAKRIGNIQNSTGGILSPFDSFLLIRGIKTLGVRMEKHVENATALAEFLEGHQAVKAVHYPGLKCDAGYDINQKQAGGGGGMISFTLQENYDINKFFTSIHVFALAESLGGIESLACHPASMTHAAIPKELRDKIGIEENLIRLSVGLEHQQDLIDDIDQALSKSRR